MTYYKNSKPYFGLGEEDKLLGFFYMGYIALPSTGAIRQPLEEKVKWIE